MIHWIPGALLWDLLQGSRSPGIPPYARRILPGGIGTTSLTPTYFMIKWERDCTTLHSCAPRLLRYLLRYRPLFPSCINSPGYPCCPGSPTSPDTQAARDAQMPRHRPLCCLYTLHRSFPRTGRYFWRSKIFISRIYKTGQKIFEKFSCQVSALR
jgi:hypothetical protein